MHIHLSRRAKAVIDVCAKAAFLVMCSGGKSKKLKRVNLNKILLGSDLFFLAASDTISVSQSSHTTFPKCNNKFQQFQSVVSIDLVGIIWIWEQRWIWEHLFLNPFLLVVLVKSMMKIYLVQQRNFAFLVNKNRTF
ncbi:MAG: hypothetical protein AAGA80_06540 [Cyanobacteria bacterium P01_F01_bin.143]